MSTRRETDVLHWDTLHSQTRGLLVVSPIDPPNHSLLSFPYNLDHSLVL